MAREVTVTCSLAVRKGSVSHSASDRFQAAVSAEVAKGPVPGAVGVAVLGTDVSLAELGDPGWGRVKNIDSTNTLTVGCYHVAEGVFTPFCDLAPGQSVALCLPAGYGDTDATGTGGVTPSYRLRIKGVGGASVALCEFFER